MLNKTKIKIEEGMNATYNGGGHFIPIVICDVKSDNTGTYFNARDRRTGTLLRKKGIPISWRAEYAIVNGQIVLEEIVIAEGVKKEGTIEYDVLKTQRDALREFFVKDTRFNGEPFVLDDEQLDAVLSEKNTLVTARAGSGKTRTLIAKLIYLFEKKGLRDNNVLAFCFNHDASVEISDRLNNRCKISGVSKYEDYDVAKTFHSFSRNAFMPEGKILADRTRLIKQIINELRRSDFEFSRRMYDFFRRETLRIDRKNFEKPEDFYRYIRNSEYTTLNNEKVKSKIEKYIADFLFEYGIDYIYERSYYPYKISFEGAYVSREEKNRWSNFVEEKKEIVPDFYLPQYNLIWEHWGVDGSETNLEVRQFENTVGDYQEYLKNRAWKQKFWSSRWRNSLSNINKYNRDIKSVTTFLETTHKQLELGTRENVERELYRILSSKGIRLQKLPEKVLIDKVWEKSIDAFTILIDQFINKLQQNYFDNIDTFIEKAKEVKEERSLTYYRMGFQVYKKYIEILSSNNNKGEFAVYNNYVYDFNQLIYDCSRRIRAGELDDRLKEVKWLLIDEYQDFSRLFDYLINSILERNGEIKLFCVGDDWQAINRFAGSDLKYFKTFANRYSNSALLNIRNNYRSENHIVHFANRFMDKYGFHGARPKSSIISKGKSEEIDINGLFVGKFNDENIYIKYLQERENKKFEKAKYLKACADIIKGNQDKKIMVLNRSNTILSKELEEFNIVLRKICSEFMSAEKFNENVFVKTVHKSKGEEADIVIVLNVNYGVFPVYNNNNALFEVFDETVIDAMEDELRLYYVALTRAKHSLYVLYDGDNKSGFIME